MYCKTVIIIIYLLTQIPKIHFFVSRFRMLTICFSILHSVFFLALLCTYIYQLSSCDFYGLIITIANTLRKYLPRTEQCLPTTIIHRKSNRVIICEKHLLSVEGRAAACALITSLFLCQPYLLLPISIV